MYSIHHKGNHEVLSQIQTYHIHQPRIKLRRGHTEYVVVTLSSLSVVLLEVTPYIQCGYDPVDPKPPCPRFVWPSSSSESTMHTSKGSREAWHTCNSRSNLSIRYTSSAKLRKAPVRGPRYPESMMPTWFANTSGDFDKEDRGYM